MGLDHVSHMLVDAGLLILLTLFAVNCGSYHSHMLCSPLVVNRDILLHQKVIVVVAVVLVLVLVSLLGGC